MKKLLLLMFLLHSGCAYNSIRVHNNCDGTVTIYAETSKPVEFTTDAQASVLP